MPGIDLKHYDTYLQSLELYAEASGLTVEYGEMDSPGVYVPSRRKIRIDPDLSQSKEIAVFLHELGHSIDPSITAKATEKKLDGAHYANKASKRQSALVLACEERAWANARDIAKKLRIPLGKWFDNEETDCLNGYGRKNE
jgi:hypothetical protein